MELNDLKNTAVSDIAALTDRANSPHVTRLDDPALQLATAYVVVPENHKLLDLADYLPNPKRVKAARAFVSLESFVRYVNEFKVPGSRLFVDRSGNAHCILDDHHRVEGGPVAKWGEHTARFNISHTAQWSTWYRSNKQSFDQRSFAAFIENNQPDFVSPTGAHMLDVAKTLDAEQSSAFKSAIRVENNDVQVSFQRTTNLKAGQTGDLNIPTQFTLGIPILEGEDARTIEARLRIDLENDKLKLSYEILRLQQLQDGVVRSVYVTLANSTGLTPFLVANIANL